MRPLRVKASGSPVSSSNYQGLQEMTDTEIEKYYSAIITKDFADNTDGTGTGELNVTTNASGAGTTIGTVTDTKRDDAVGTHPTDGASSTVTTYTAKQVTGAASESITNRPVGWETSGNVGINEFTDSELDSDIIDKVIADLVGQGNYTVGQYSLNASSPSGGTWTSRYTLADTQVDGTTNNMYIWQKTAATTAADDDLKPIKLVETSNLREMTVAEMEQIVPNFRNRIVENFATTQGIGTYKLQASTPSETGTWTQMGDSGGFTDTKKDVAATDYSGSYSGTYGGTYAANFTGPKTYAGNYTGPKTYAGNYTGTSGYSGTYGGSSNYATAYAGAYLHNYGGYAGPPSYAGTYTGYYSGPKNYTGSYTGAKTYGGTYTGTSAYAGTYAGTSAYAGTYSGVYTGSFTGTYSGDTVKSTSSTVSTVKLWLRTA